MPLTRLGQLGDLGLALVLAVVGTAEVLVPLTSRQGHGSSFWSVAGVLVACLPLAVRRRRPLLVIAALSCAIPVVHLLGGQYVLFYGQFLPLLVASYTVARHGRGRQPAVGAVLTASCLIAGATIIPELGTASEIGFDWGVFTLAWLAALGLRVQTNRAAASLRRVVEVEVAAAGQALAAVVEERTRIARELHDIVAHSVSLMVVQAGAAEQVVQDDPDYARQALTTIRTTGAAALDEMRRAVSMLRQDDAVVSLAPQPGLDDVEALLQSARRAGLTASLAVTGNRRPLPAGVDLAAYRIVQEALSNVRRHAAASTVNVTLRYTPAELSVEVVDDGVGTTSAHSPGHGLIGMRERVAVYNGRFETGTGSPAGEGFSVRAVLPVAT